VLLTSVIGKPRAVFLPPVKGLTEDRTDLLTR